MPEEIPSDQSGVLTWFVKNTVLISGACYVYVSVIGVIYNVVFFHNYSIEILNYYDAKDYLLSGLRHPVAVIMPIVFCLIASLYYLLLWFFWRTKAPDSSLGSTLFRTPGRRMIYLLPLILSLIVYTLAIPFYLSMGAAKTADACKGRVTLVLKQEAKKDVIGSRGRVTRVRKQDTKKDANGSTDTEIKDQLLLGATSNFVFVIKPGAQTGAVGVAVASIERVTTQLALDWSKTCWLW